MLITAPTELPRQNGFTAIELVLVIVLLGILSILVLPRFSDPAAFHNRLLHDQLLSLSQLARQTALSRAGEPVLLTIEHDGQWQLRLSVDTDADGVYEQTLRHLTPDSRAVLQLQSPPLPGLAAADLQQQPLAIDYDGLGNIRAFNIGPARIEHPANLYLQLADRGLCITRAGYAYQPVSQVACDHDL